MRAKKILPLFVFLLLFIFTTPASAGLLNVSDIGDALVYQASPTKNYGTTTQITVQGTTSFTDRAFLLFNITDIPASSTISAATLKLYAFKTNLITNPKYYLVYNTSVLNASAEGPWNEGSLNGVVAAGAGISLARNITWQTQPAVDTLQDNKSVNSTEGIWYSWNVLGAVQGAYASGNNISLLIKENTENNASGRYIQFYSKEFGSNGPILEITYAPNASDCSLSCGDCDCNSTQCFYPSIVGSYCDPDQLALLGYADRILTKFANCTGDTSYECPTGSICGQITPQVNITSPLVENFVDCSACWYAKVFNIASGWHTLWTNCPLNPECDNCNGIYCQGNAFVTNLTSTPASASGYSAGCFNPDLQLIPIVIQPNGTPTSVQNLTEQVFPDAEYTYNGTCTNTSSLCFDALCNQITCPVVPSSVSTSGAGWFALSLGSLFGITDLTLSLWLFSILASMAVGFILLYYTRDSEHSGQAFMFGALLPLVGFTLISWFPAWLMVILIVLSAYLMARSIGIGGG